MKTYEITLRLDVEWLRIIEAHYETVEDGETFELIELKEV